MSSPLDSLKKARKLPLNNHGTRSNVPYRYGNDPLLDEVTTNIASKIMNKPNTKGFVSESSAPSDLDLMQTMIARIAVLEKQVQIQAKQISEKDKRIRVLEEKVMLYQKLNDEQSHSPNYVRDLESKCLLLQQQISEMEEFLTDYGMIWVGTRDSEEDDNTDSLVAEGKMWEPGTSVMSPAEFKIDYETVIQNVKELNQVAGADEHRIEKTYSGARLVLPDAIQLVLYKNGILLFDGPFRPVEDESTRECLQDLVDGYFPSELQSRYPDGVPFNVVDKRDVTFAKSDRKAFIGAGQMVGGDKVPSRLVPSTIYSQPESAACGVVESQAPGKKLTAEQFLSHMPKSVVRNGKVIDIRNSLTETLQGSNQVNQVTVIKTDTMQEIKDRLEIDESLRPPSGKNITTLRIKDTDNHTYVLKMKFSDTIQDVMNYLDEQRSSRQPYRLVTTFPNKTYNDLCENLFCAGLTPNATMHVKLKP